MSVGDKRVIFDEIFERIIGKHPDYKSLRHDLIPGWDSLKTAKLILEIESELKLTIEIRDFDQLTSYAKILNLLKL